MLSNEFAQYDDPSKARGVWNSYRKDMYFDGQVKDGIIILKDCRTAEELDVKLNSLDEMVRESHAGKISQNNIEDDDDEGEYQYAAKLFEEIRELKPHLIQF